MSTTQDIEYRSIRAIEDVQTEKLREALRYAETNSPFYKKQFSSLGISSSDIHSLTDIVKLPVTTKDDLHNHNWDFLCVPRNEIREYTSTSGTLGKPVTIALTQSDLRRLAYNEFISFRCADGSPDDTYQLAVTLDRQFMAGLAYYEGIRELGAGLIRIGPGLPALQWDTIERLKPTTIVAVPSFILKLIEYAAENEIDFKNSSITKAICIGEGIRNDQLQPNVLGSKISEAWNIQLFSTYASTEMQTAFTECRYGCGGHHHPELIHVELLDDNNVPVEEGTAGEITITTFGVKGMPLIRYKTGDMARVHREACQCGRNTLRVGPIAGRKQQMIKLKGTSIYPTNIFEILNKNRHIQNYVIEATSGELGTDDLLISIAVKPPDQATVKEQITEAFKSHLRVAPQLRFVSAAEIELMQLSGNSRKVNRFLDKRR